MRISTIEIIESQAMSVFLWILIFLVSGLLFSFFILSAALASFSSPQKESDALDHIRRFLGFDFREGFTVIKYESRNNHPDRPLKVSIVFSEDAFREVRQYLSGIGSHVEESFHDDGSVRYVLRAGWKNNVFWKKHEASRVVPDAAAGEGYGHVFFMASLMVDCDEKKLDYKETSV